MCVCLNPWRERKPSCCPSPPLLFYAWAWPGALSSSLLAFCHACSTLCHCRVPSLCSQEAVLECEPALLGPFALQGSFPWDSAKQVLEEAKIHFSKVQGCNPAVCLTPLWIFDSTVSCNQGCPSPLHYPTVLPHLSNRMSPLVFSVRAPGDLLLKNVQCISYVYEGVHYMNRKKEQCSLWGNNSWKYSFLHFLFQ